MAGFLHTVHHLASSHLFGTDGELLRHVVVQTTQVCLAMGNGLIFAEKSISWASTSPCLPQSGCVEWFSITVIIGVK